MKKPELTDVGWLGPKDEMDRASHRFGKCSNCDEIIRNCTYGGRHSFPISPDPYAAAPTVVRSFLRKDLIRSDSCFDSWINFSVSEINRTIFLFSSSILPRNKAESSSSCFDLGMTCVLVSSNRAPSDAIIRLHKRATPRKGARRRDV